MLWGSGGPWGCVELWAGAKLGTYTFRAEVRVYVPGFECPALPQEQKLSSQREQEVSMMILRVPQSLSKEPHCTSQGWDLS